MAKSLHLLPVFALFFLIAAAAETADLHFQVEGRVYCDNCRFGFATNISEYIEGATVKLECRHFETGAVEQSLEATTGSEGYYRFDVPRDHEEDICYVMLVRSPRVDCTEIDEDRNQARILLTKNSGQADNVRFANSLGFMKDAAVPACRELLKAYVIDSGFY